MRNIYPKLITTLFLILFVAMLIKYGDADSRSNSSQSASTTIVRTSQHAN